MRFSSLLLFLLFSVTAQAQAIAIGYKYSPDEIAKARAVVSQKTDTPMGISVGGSYTTVELENAKKIIRESQPKALKLEVGEFEVIEPAASVTSPLLWIVQDDTICQRIDIKPNQPFGVWMKRRGEVAARYHAFEAKPFGWILLIGVKQGQSITHIVRNGANDKEAPAVIDKLDVTVGEVIPPKPPEPPVGDPLVKSFRNAAAKDATLGKADKQWLLPLAGIFEMASEDSLDGLTKIADINSRLLAARKAAGIPEPDLQFPSLREAIRQEIYRALNVGENDGNVTLTADTKRLAKVCFGKISKALEVLAK